MASVSDRRKRRATGPKSEGLFTTFVPPLPFAPRPFSDELLLSWLCRLAAANHVRLCDLLPEVLAMSFYRLNCDPGEEIISRLAAMARLSPSALHCLLLPKRFPNLSLLSFSQPPKPSVVSSHEMPSDSISLPFCNDCAGEAEHTPRSLYWQVEAGLFTTILCPRHGSPVGRYCPKCNQWPMTLAWDHPRLIVRCLRCDWRPVMPPKRTRISSDPQDSLELLFRLQCDLVAALRHQAPSSFWCGTTTAIQFLRVVDDLHWLLRTPGLSALCGEEVYAHRWLFLDQLLPRITNPLHPHPILALLGMEQLFQRRVARCHSCHNAGRSRLCNARAQTLLPRTD